MKFLKESIKPQSLYRLRSLLDLLLHHLGVDRYGLRHIISLVNANHFVGQLKHIVTQANDNEL